MSRRTFVRGIAGIGLGVAGLVWLGGCGLFFPDTRPKVARVGFLLGYRQDYLLGQRYAEAFRTGMRELGWIEGQNLVLETRYAEGHTERLPDLAVDLVRLPVDVLVAAGANAGMAARDATSTIPIVLAASNDPVATGLVTSLAHPGGNVTGVSFGRFGAIGSFGSSAAPKSMELLKAIVPSLTRAAILLNPLSALTAVQAPLWEETASSLAVGTLRFEVRSADDFEAAFSRARAWPAQALIVLSDSGFINSHYAVIADLAVRSRLPSITVVGEYVQAGGFMSYGPNVPVLYTRAAYYVDRVLGGAKPAELPVEQPTTFDFIVNLKTAQALGITFPPEVAAQVTEWIQ